MNDEKEDPILAAPKEESPEATTTSSTIPEEKSSDEKEQIRLNYDQRRFSLLNNPTYGVILAFLDKFRAHIDLQDYPLHLLEENLLNDQENISRRLIDFHFTLLKRISLGKGAQREKFVSIITKFAYRFDFDDGEYLKTNGYSRAEMNIKLRILKNLLETQFDHNQGFKTALLEKPSFEIRSQPFGRDRSGAFYWLFKDSECFIRIFRENVDDDRTWTNIVKDKDELENLIKLLITDQVVRKKFSEWKFTHEPFNALETSNEFQERYIPNIITIKKEEVEDQQHVQKEMKVKSSKRSISVAAPVKIERGVTSKPKKSPSPPPMKNEVQSEEESSNSVDKTSQHSTIPSSEDINANVVAQEINNNQDDKQLKKPRGRRKSKNWNKKKRRAVSNPPAKKEEPKEEIKTPPKGRKRKHIIDTDDESQTTKKNEQTSQKKEIEDIPFDEELLNDDNLPIALRRSRRARKAPPTPSPAVTSSPTKSVSQSPTKKKLTNGKSQNSSQIIVKSSQKRKKTGKGRRKGKHSTNGVSSSDEEHQPSEEEEDEYNSDDYLPDNKKVDELDEDDLYEEEDDDYTPRRSAKTVAKRRGQMTEDLQIPSSACCVCFKTDRPESLLLCDDCDDAYHLECLKPILLAVPDGDWYCPLCEHKRLCDNFIEKFIQLIKEHEELEVKRNQCMSKRTNRLANVMLNLDRMVKRSSKKRRTNGIVYSDEENEDEEDQPVEDDEQEEEEEEEEEHDDDDDSVYGFKDDGSIDGGEKSKRSSNSRRGRHEMDEPERLGVRSCRRKTKNYRFDDYDKKLKEAMIQAGEDGEEIDRDLADSDEDPEEKPTKKRNVYDKDEDFNAADAKNDDEFAPDQARSDGSGTEEEESDYDDEESSDDGGWKSKRRTSSRKKPAPKPTRRKTRNKLSDDDSLSDTELDNLQSFNTTKSETTNDLDLSNDDRRRSSRATTQKNYAKQENDDDDESNEDDYYENGRPPPRRMRYKKRRGSDDSFVEDDDYERIARKRKIVQYGKSISRSSITDHLNKLVNEDEKPAEEKATEDGMEVDTNDAGKEQEKNSAVEYNDQPPSDDDDFPDEKEIFQANGLLKLQKTISGPKPPSVRPPFPAPTHSYQHAIVDPTARFTMIRPPIRPNGYPINGHDNEINILPQPSDSNPVNSYNNQSS